MTGQALIVQGDALRLPLPDASVDLVVTSPPFAFLRAYDTGYPHLEVGAEATPAEFLEHLWQATAEMVRVLKPTGSMFIDLGDKYVDVRGNDKPHTGSAGIAQPGQARNFGQVPWRDRGGLRAKSLMLLPERYRIGCVDRLGLIARAVIVWNKPNGLPESVTDRVQRSHEDWVHLTKQPRYYSAIDEVREAYSDKTNWTWSPETHIPKGATPVNGGPSRLRVKPEGSLGKLPGSVWTIPSEPLSLPGYFVTEDGTLRDFLAPSRGRPRTRPSSNGHGLFDPDTFAEVVGGEDAGAWRWLRATGINASPWPQTNAGLQLRTAASHYAAFPSRWPEQLIKGFSPPGICLDCGQGRVPVVEREKYLHRPSGAKNLANPHGPEKVYGNNMGNIRTEATILGYACACTPHTNHPGSGERQTRDYQPMPDARPQGTYGRKQAGEYQSVGPWREYHIEGWRPPPTRPAVVLDPFMGTGTVLGVARQLGRIGVGTDLSFPYCRAARYRVFQSCDFGKAAGRTWKERQGSLL